MTRRESNLTLELKVRNSTSSETLTSADVLTSQPRSSEPLNDLSSLEDGRRGSCVHSIRGSSSFNTVQLPLISGWCAYALVAMALNLDEIYNIMSYLPGTDIVNVMCTCREVYELGLPILLGSPIVLRNQKIYQFLRFFCKDSLRYGAMIRDVTLVDISSSDDEGSVLCSHLSSFLQHSPNLHSFKVDDMDMDMSIIPTLMQTLLTSPADRRALRVVGFSVRRFNPSFLVDMASKSSSWDSLVDLQLEWLVAVGNYDWVTSIEQLAPNLVSLTITTLPFAIMSKAFPRLRTLYITSRKLYHESIFSTSKMVQLFPRLQNLWFQRILVPWSDVHALRAVRENNMRDALTTGNDHRAWSQLENLRIGWDTLYAMGTRRPVRRLDLGFLISSTFRWFRAEVVTECQPKALKVDIPLQRQTIDRLRTILRNSPQLQHLEYSVSMHDGIATHELGPGIAELNELVEMHRPLSCTFLRVCFTRVIPKVGPRNVRDAIRGTPMQEYMKNTFDPEDFVQRLIDTCPTLKRILVHWDQNIRPPIFVNVIVEDDGRRRARTASDDEHDKYNIFKLAEMNEYEQPGIPWLHLQRLDGSVSQARAIRITRHRECTARGAFD
ncbi:hypothetical protein K474DRAFT_1702046 [Panus rudis PR-1116 ss-1]|nr:hypothetical protein K474DRAFT_1702046 [Panus rudis PR-1116 ss-1]